MLADSECFMRRNGADELFPSRPQPLIPKKAADMLESHLITGFEAALEQGVKPADALALVLSWVSSEMVRLGVDRPGGCS